MSKNGKAIKKCLRYIFSGTWFLMRDFFWVWGYGENLITTVLVCV